MKVSVRNTSILATALIGATAGYAFASQPAPTSLQSQKTAAVEPLQSPSDSPEPPATPTETPTASPSPTATSEPSVHPTPIPTATPVSVYRTHCTITREDGDFLTPGSTTVFHYKYTGTETWSDGTTTTEELGESTSANARPANC